ncbi:hypothetical protein [Brevibacillus dissolubilis]|uniref:hypothetical protein n=1 Tax=Brevibacillus dissolubilis TaxID=1844116 RepID=UPI0011173C52|nr:hypothetical protein [Brevibacillus dissolubilis]
MQEIPSIVHFCRQHFEAALYRDPLPADKLIPALYVPTPMISDRPDTTQTYMRVVTLTLRIYHVDSLTAFAVADELAERIASARYQIPLVDDGEVPTGEVLRLEGSEFAVVEEGVAQLTLKWRNRYYYQRATYEKIKTLHVEEQVK